MAYKDCTVCHARSLSSEHLQGFQPLVDTVLFIAHAEDHIPGGRAADADGTQQIDQPRPAHVHENQPDAQQQHGAGQVGLDKHQTAGDA